MKLLQILLGTYKEEYELNLKEGLIKTTNIGKTIELLKKFSTNKVDIKKEGNAFEATFIGKDIGFLDKFLRDTNNLGWFPSYLSTSAYKGKWDEKFYDDYLSKIRFEAKFDEEVVENIPSILYHIVPTQNIDKILKIGLVPKSRSKASYHPERVYLGRTIEGIEKLVPQMSLRTGDKNYTILKINTEMIPGEYLRLYTDPNYVKEAYYTLNNIPPQAIEKVKEINL
jgi:hypothetical protein